MIYNKLEGTTSRKFLIGKNGAAIESRDGKLYVIDTNGTEYIVGTDMLSDNGLPTAETIRGAIQAVINDLDEFKIEIGSLLATDQDGFINTLSEILEIFSNYPEGVDVAYQFSLKADKTEVPILDEYGYIPEVYFADTLIDGGLFTSDLHVNDIDGGSF